jgi:hypothetical protein
MKHYCGSKFLNVGTGLDITIAEFAQLVADVVGYSGRLVSDASRPDGAPQKLLNVAELTRPLAGAPKLRYGKDSRRLTQIFLPTPASGAELLPRRGKSNRLMPGHEPLGLRMPVSSRLSVVGLLRFMRSDLPNQHIRDCCHLENLLSVIERNRYHEFCTDRQSKARRPRSDHSRSI